MRHDQSETDNSTVTPFSVPTSEQYIIIRSMLFQSLHQSFQHEQLSMIETQQ